MSSTNIKQRGSHDGVEKIALLTREEAIILGYQVGWIKHGPTEMRIVSIEEINNNLLYDITLDSLYETKDCEGRPVLCWCTQLTQVVTS